MSEYTSITDGLRGSMKRVQVFGSPFVQKEAIYFDQMCDAIDSVHAALEADNERLCGEWDFWESTHVELPKDADGEYIHIGDVMDFSKNVRNLTVLGIGMVNESECSWGVFVRDGRDYVWYNAKFLRHHAPTVEDVLREFANEVYADADNEIRDRDFLCAKYAKRLTLVGDAE